MQRSNLDEIARKVANVLARNCRNTPFCLQLLRLLAGGQPVTPSHLATALHFSHEEVAKNLRESPEIEFDHEGNIVGSGLTMIPTPHHFLVNGHELFTWCGLDALSYPVILKLPSRVESPCPVTGKKVRLTVTPERIDGLDPMDAVVSLVVPEATTCSHDIRGKFCNFGHFFSSPEAASA